jgi:hypothetical protein
MELRIGQRHRQPARWLPSVQAVAASAGPVRRRQPWAGAASRPSHGGGVDDEEGRSLMPARLAGAAGVGGWPARPRPAVHAWAKSESWRPAGAAERRLRRQRAGAGRPRWMGRMDGGMGEREVWMAEVREPARMTADQALPPIVSWESAPDGRRAPGRGWQRRHGPDRCCWTVYGHEGSTPPSVCYGGRAGLRWLRARRGRWRAAQQRVVWPLLLFCLRPLSKLAPSPPGPAGPAAARHALGYGSSMASPQIASRRGLLGDIGTGPTACLDLSQPGTALRCPATDQLFTQR